MATLEDNLSVASAYLQSPNAHTIGGNTQPPAVEGEGGDFQSYAQAVGKPSETLNQRSPPTSKGMKWQDHNCNLILFGVDEQDKVHNGFNVL